MRYICQGTSRDGNGRVVLGATVSVYLAGTTTAASIYAASSGGTAVGSVTSSSTTGKFVFYVDSADYEPTQLFDVTFSCSGYETKTWENIRLIVSAVPWVNVKDYGAVGDGSTDDTTAIQEAIDRVAAGDTTNGIGGGTVFFPPGTYAVSALTVTQAYTKIFGSGMSCTQIIRSADATNDLISVTGTGFGISDIKLMEPLAGSAWTNTGTLLKLTNVSDIEISKVWFDFSYDQIYADVADNIIIEGCIFEASRHAEIYGNQLSLAKIVGNSFFAANLDSAHRTAAIYIKKDSGYTFNANNVNIVGNYFFYARYGHFISLKDFTGAQIVGNFFHLAGMYDAGSADDIILDTCDKITITGNTSNLVNNNYIADNRASRYVVNIGGTCTNIEIVGNQFEAGITGTINNVSLANIYYPIKGSPSTGNIVAWNAGGYAEWVAP